MPAWIVLVSISVAPVIYLVATVRTARPQTWRANLVEALMMSVVLGIFLSVLWVHGKDRFIADATLLGFWPASLGIGVWVAVRQWTRKARRRRNKYLWISGFRWPRGSQEWTRRHR